MRSGGCIRHSSIRWLPPLLRRERRLSSAGIPGLPAACIGASRLSRLLRQNQVSLPRHRPSSSRGRARLRDPVAPRGHCAATNLRSRSLVASSAVLLVGDRSRDQRNSCRLSTAFEKTQAILQGCRPACPYVDSVVLAEFGKSGPHRGEQSWKWLKHYARSFVPLVEAACCSGFDCYVLVLATCRLWITASESKRAIRRFGALQTWAASSNGPETVKLTLVP